MEQKTPRLYPFAPIRKKQSLKIKLEDVKSFNNSTIDNIKEMITYCKDNNHKPKKH